MLFLTLAAAFLAFFAVVVPVVHAEDFRLLIKFSPKKYASGAAFCATWESSW
jgi:hypothetical protein